MRLLIFSVAALKNNIMGNWVSIPFLEAERATWITNHDVVVDQAEVKRIKDLKLLNHFKLGQEMKVCYVESSYQGFAFRHYFVTNGSCVIEFGAETLSIYDARVRIGINMPKEYHFAPGKKKFFLDEKMMKRITKVLGMKNYSLCLRNCEHVANFIIKNRWVSMQMIDGKNGIIIEKFKEYLLGDNMSKVNTFPVCLRKDYAMDEGPLYDFVSVFVKFQCVDYFLDANEDTRNYLIIGPTGCGKSRMVNAFFNQHVADEEESLESVTRDVIFYRGKAVYTTKSSDGSMKSYQRTVVLIDTIGLCDSEWDEQAVIDIIKHRVSANVHKIHGVLVLNSSIERLRNEAVVSINNLLSWLNFSQNRECFRFLLTKADRMENRSEDALDDKIATIVLKFDVKEVKGQIPVYFSDLPVAPIPTEEREAFADKLLKRIWDNFQDPRTALTVNASQDAGCAIM